ncbi:unnamed protein product [Symbiodinium sp. KB8]|nr:unnamed protein product [Symbiodinium sp. KB8]
MLEQFATSSTGFQDPNIRHLSHKKEGFLANEDETVFWVMDEHEAAKMKSCYGKGNRKGKDKGGRGKGKGCTRAMGSRYAINRLIKAVERYTEKLTLWFKTTPPRDATIEVLGQGRANRLLELIRALVSNHLDQANTRTAELQIPIVLYELYAQLAEISGLRFEVFGDLTFADHGELPIPDEDKEESTTMIYDVTSDVEIPLSPPEVGQLQQEQEEPSPHSDDLADIQQKTPNQTELTRDEEEQVLQALPQLSSSPRDIFNCGDARPRATEQQIERMQAYAHVSNTAHMRELFNNAKAAQMAVEALGADDAKRLKGGLDQLHMLQLTVHSLAVTTIVKNSSNSTARGLDLLHVLQLTLLIS